MLEKIGQLILLAMIDVNYNFEEAEFFIKNISQYLYSNFLNFIDTILAKFGATNTKSDVR